MAHIRSRKYAQPDPQAISPGFNPSLMALALAMPLAMPLTAHAQQATAAEQTLPEVKVKSTAEVPYKADRVSSPKLTQPLVDTPQTISVIKKEIMQEQGAVNIMEALRNTPGITMQLGENGNTSAGDTFQMRGFSAQSSIFVDGVRDLGAVTRDTFNIDQIEVVKGPAGSDIGRGASSGYINLVSKVPLNDDFNNGTASWNSANNKRATADLNRKIGDTSAMRLNVTGQKGGVAGRDEVESNGYGFAPSLAFGLGTPTRFYFYAQHMLQNNVPDGGVSTVGLPGFFNTSAALLAARPVDPKNFYGSINDYEKIKADMASARFEHDFGDGMVVRNIARYGKSSMDRVLTGVNTPSAVVAADPSTWTVARTRQQVDQKNEIFANQSNIAAEFGTGPVRHSLSGGVEIMLEKQSSIGFAAPAATAITAANLYHPHPNDALPLPTRNGANTDGSTTTAAVYASDTLKLGESWLLNGGLRVEHYNTVTNSIALSTLAANPTLPVGTLLPANLNKNDNLLSWKVGALYKPAKNGSIYAAYANSLTPPGSANFSLSSTAGNINSPALDPQKTTNIELGTKWDLLQKTLALTAALYRTDNTNEITLLDPVTNTFGQLGKRRVKGIELGAVGQLSKAWQISAGLATMKTRVLAGTTGNNAAGAATRWSPDLTATLWTTWKLAGNWNIGGGTRYVSEQKRTIDPTLPLATQNMPSIPAYWVADALLSYQATKNVSLQMNIYNLFDKTYISTLNNGGARYMPGAPRSATLTANLQF